MVVFGLCCSLAGTGAGDPPSDQDLARMIEVLRPLLQKLGPPQPGDWLETHSEPGQTFQDYLECEPVLATEERRTIYVQPIGAFSAGQRRILRMVREGMEAYLGLPVKPLPPLPDAVIPQRARRTLQETGEPQFLTSYILDKVLLPKLPEDAAACIAFTEEDLWPGKGWNFVFGQASVRNRVGVWSMARFGDPDAGSPAFRLCLVRTLGTAIHETCHMFSMRHCTEYECVMCGSDSLEEGDRHPLWFCPECMAKLCHAVQADPMERFIALVAFYRSNGLGEEARFYRKSIRRLESRWKPTGKSDEK